MYLLTLTILNGGNTFFINLLTILFTMKKKFLLMGIMLMGFAALFTTSCVQGDLFDDLYEDTDGWFPRSKKGKDNGGGDLPGEYYLGRQYGYHRVVNALQCGCSQRSLTAKFGGEWKKHIVSAVEEFVGGLSKEDATSIKSKYYTNGKVDENKVINSCSMECGLISIIINKSGGNGGRGLAGRICKLTCADHTVYIVRGASIDEANQHDNCCIDMDGNIWNGNMLQVYP